MDVDGQEKPSCLTGDTSTIPAESESNAETKKGQDQPSTDQASNTPGKSAQLNGTANKVNGTADTKVTKVTGSEAKVNGTTPKRDLTAPTKSSAAKARQPVTANKTDGKTNSAGVKGERLSKGKEDHSGDTKAKDKKSPKDSPNSKTNKGDNSGDQHKGKSSSGGVSHTKHSVKQDSKKEECVPEVPDTSDTKQENSSVNNQNQNGEDPGDLNRSKENKEDIEELSDSDDSTERIYVRPKPSTPQHYEPIVKPPETPKGIVTASMATCQCNEPGIENTEIIVVKDGQIKYINTEYKKVPGRIYDHNCDVKLVVNGAKFKAHRDVLSEASDYFSAMFSHDMKEKEQFTIELKEISPQGFTAMLEYFYHGYITIATDNIEDTIEAARFFHVNWILECACHYLVYHMSIENYNTVMALSDKFCLGDLRIDIFKFFASNLEMLTKQKNFYQNVSFELLLQFLMENIFTEPSEYFLLQMIMKWISVDPENRKENMLALLRQIRFPIMEMTELEELTDDVIAHPEIKECVQHALDYSYNIVNQCMNKGDIYQLRGARTVIVILSFSAEGNYLFYRDPSKPGLTVEELGPCGFFTADYHAMAQTKIGNFLYAAGGYDENFGSSGRVFRFDPRYREWMEVAPMNVPRVSFAMCSSNSSLFAVAGVQRIFSDGNDATEVILDSVESYNPSENTWTSLAPLPVKCFDTATAHHNNCLYVTGGISLEMTDSCPLKNMWCLDVNGSEGWVPKQSMLHSRQGHSLTPHDGKLYALGGYTTVNDAQYFVDCLENEVYDFETDQWTDIAPTPPEFGHLFRHCDIYDSVIFVLGGHTASSVLFMYDTEENKWDEVEGIGPNVQKLAILDVALP